MSIEQRQTPRKILRTRAMLVMDGSEPVPGRTIEIGAHGMSLTVADPVKPGKLGKVIFELLVDGKVNLITARAAVSHCILGSEGFKAGFSFQGLDQATMAVIAKYMR